MNLGDGGLKTAAVFDWELQQKLVPHMEAIRPRPAAFFQDFVAANQADRADNVLTGTKWEIMEQISFSILKISNIAPIFMAQVSVKLASKLQVVIILLLFKFVASTRHSGFQVEQRPGQGHWNVGRKHGTIRGAH